MSFEESIKLPQFLQIRIYTELGCLHSKIADHRILACLLVRVFFCYDLFLLFFFFFYNGNQSQGKMCSKVIIFYKLYQKHTQ